MPTYTGNAGLQKTPGIIKLAFMYGNVDAEVSSSYPNGVVTNNNIVSFMGSLTISNASNWANGHVLFNVPEKARPSKTYVQIPAMLIKSGGSWTDWQVVVIRIAINGDVSLRRPLDAGTWFLYLNGLCYSVNQTYYSHNPNA